MAIVIRKDAWKLSTASMWEPTLLWYAKAVGELSSRPASDPTSWRFQAGVHGYKKNSDPFAASGGLPPKSIQSKYWNQCQHGSWYFLPWHRMYLGFFEQIVRAAVVKLGGPSDWTLPYWNYSDTSNPKARTLPPAFLQATLPDGSANPLSVIQGVKIVRDPQIDAGNQTALPAGDVSLSGCLQELFFSPATDTTVGDLGFGGPATGFNHDGLHFGANSVESVPHNAVHVDVGGQNGWMINPDTAALDPIFWLHHANIDRLWSVWNGISSANTDPSAPVNVGGRKVTWATTKKFGFYDATGKAVTMTSNQVVDTRKTGFRYDYQDTSNPFASATTSVVTAARRSSMSKVRPEMVGATSRKLSLIGSVQTTGVAIQEPSKPRTTLAEPPTGKFYLYVEHIVSKSAHTTYEVYVNLPAKPDATAYEEHRAGAIHLFGVRHASKRTGEHAGNGLSYSFDITPIVDRLKAKNLWDGQNLQVTFAPRDVGEHEPITIGRVSIYRA